MGLAWLDDLPPDSTEPALRSGGLPLLPETMPWPACPTCGLALLFRAQVPLALTSLVPFDDPRLLLVFECYAVHDDGPCDGAVALLVRDPLTPRLAPQSRTSDVVLLDTGKRPAEVRRIVEAVGGTRGTGRMVLPCTILRASPSSIARETVRAISEAGGRATARETAPTVLGRVYGGRLVPFDDGPAASFRTTLPPLDRLAKQPEVGGLRGLLGGSLPGYRDHAFTCSCARPTRTAVRLLAARERDPASGITLGATVAQVCLPCRLAMVQRTPSGRARSQTGIRPRI